MLAARGTRETDEGLRPVEDAGEREALKSQARGVYLRTTLFAVAVTALAWFLP